MGTGRLIAFLVLGCTVVHSEGQVLKFLHQFNGSTTNSFGVFTNDDGSSPGAGLVLSGKTLYGTASAGGSEGYGTIYGVNLDGGNFRVVHHFSATVAPDWTNSDGASPQGGLIESGNTLYGTTQMGGRYGSGTIFAVSTDGNDFRDLHDFAAVSAPYYRGSNSGGAFPEATLALAGQTLYGTTSGGGKYGSGTVFAVNQDGTGFTNIHDFSAEALSIPGSLSAPYTNYDGAMVFGPLIVSNSTLYGMAEMGGTNGSGTIFTLQTDGSAFTTLHNFDFFEPNVIPAVQSLTLSGATLYGAKDIGGTRYGDVFSVSTDGSSFSRVYTFTNDSEGANPVGLALSQNTLYGVTQGGTVCDGAVFAVNTDGTGFTNLYFFPPVSGPNWAFNRPVGALVSSQTALFGVMQSAGLFGMGAVFSLSFPPQLSIDASGTNFVVSWPANHGTFDYGSYVLESATNLAAPVWATNLAAPVVINGRVMVTNPIAKTGQLFRLSQYGYY